MSNPLLPGAYGASFGFYGDLAITTAAQTLAALIGSAVPKGATGCLVQVIGADVVYRTDGVAPTAGLGWTLFAGQPPMWISGAQMRLMQLIQGAGGAATLNVEFF